MQTTQKQIIYQQHLEAGRRIFVDAKSYNDTVVSASYRLMAKLFPTSQLTQNCARIFDLQAALYELDPIYDRVVANLFYMSMSYAETGRRIDLSAAQVSTLENKAIWQLRKSAKKFLV